MEKLLSFCKKAFFLFLKACFMAIVFILCIHLFLQHKVSSNVARCTVAYEQCFCKQENCYVAQCYSSDEAFKATASEQVALTLGKFPEDIRKVIKEEWIIVFTPNIPAAVTKEVGCALPSNAAGGTISDVKTIFVLTTDTRLWEYVLTHEICHAIGSEYGNIDYGREFEKIYDLYKDSYQEPFEAAVQGYATSSQVEFFASTLSMYITEPDALRQTAPCAYNFFDGLLADKIDGNAIEEAQYNCLRFFRTWNFLQEAND